VGSSPTSAQSPVIGFAVGFGAHQRDGGLGGGLPVDEEVFRGPGEEEVAGDVRPAVPVGGVAVEHRRVQGPEQRVADDDVHAAVADEGQ
jgi:hypothetical protein